MTKQDPASNVDRPVDAKAKSETTVSSSASAPTDSASDSYSNSVSDRTAKSSLDNPDSRTVSSNVGSSVDSAADSDPVRKRLKIAISMLAGLLVVSLVVLGWQLYLGPQRDAQKALDGFAAQQGPVTAVNSEMVTFEGQKLEAANVDQKALAQEGVATTPPAFIFSNGKDSESKKELHFYFDFSDQRSRDALISNSISLRALVESGQVELHLHPLFGGRAYSMYAAEALAEVFAAQEELAWDSLMVLLRNAPVLAAVDSNEELLKSLVSALRGVGVSVADEESIANGTFATWLLSIGNDPTINGAVAPKLPYILVENSPLNLSVDQLNNPDAFKRSVIKEISK